MDASGAGIKVGGNGADGDIPLFPSEASGQIGANATIHKVQKSYLVV